MNWKKIGKYSFYIVPCYGAYKEWKKPKKERSILGTIGFSIYAIPFVVKIVTLPLYLGTGVATKEWNPLNHIKSFIENIKEKKQSKLENIMYEEAIKSLEN